MGGIGGSAGIVDAVVADDRDSEITHVALHSQSLLSIWSPTIFTHWN
jgi:hypothetical protein